MKKSEVGFDVFFLPPRCCMYQPGVSNPSCYMTFSDYIQFVYTLYQSLYQSVSSRFKDIDGILTWLDNYINVSLSCMWIDDG